MTVINITLSQLRGMIGQIVIVENKDYRIIEVLEHSTELVLQVQHLETNIQPDQHGDAHRRVPATITIPVLTEDKLNIHPSFLELDLA